MRFLILVWMLLWTAPGARAVDFDLTPDLQRAYADLLKLKVQEGRREIGGELARNNGLAVYLDNYADMVTLLVSDNRALYEQWADREDQRLSRIRDLDENSPWQRFAQAEVRLHWAFVKLKFGKEASACWDIIRAYKLLEENRRQFPAFLPTYKSLGILHVLIGSVPENYTWVANLLGLRGNVKQGLRELETVIQKSPDFRTEAQLCSLLLRTYVLKFTPEEGNQLRQLVRDNPDSLLLHFFATTIFMKEARSEEALTYLKTRPTGPAYLAFPILEYLEAEILLQKADYPQAAVTYRHFVSQYKGVNFLKDVVYKQGLCAWLTNDDARAIPLFRQTQQVGATVVEADKAAQKFAELFFKHGVSPRQKILLRARFATDGGFYETALNALRPYAEASFPLLAEKAEFNYRKGRIEQRRGNEDAAIPYFERAIALSEAEQLSFGATAALQLGYIYQQKRAGAKAKPYFQKALSYKKHEYKNSIDNKARAALNELGE